jgi:hypothetical protein
MDVHTNIEGIVSKVMCNMARCSTNHNLHESYRLGLQNEITICMLEQEHTESWGGESIYDNCSIDATSVKLEMSAEYFS